MIFSLRFFLVFLLLTNSGTLAGRQIVNINADSIHNLNGTITGNAVVLDAQTDINNLGGKIIASDALILNAGRDINVSSTTHSETNVAGASSFSGTNLDRVAGLYVTDPNGLGLLSVNAGNNVNLQAAEIQNAGANGQTVIKAGNDINLTTVTTGKQNNSVADSLSRPTSQ